MRSEIRRIVRRIAVAFLNDAVKSFHRGRGLAIRREVVILEGLERLPWVPHPAQRKIVFVVVNETAVKYVLRNIKICEKRVLVPENVRKEPREAIDVRNAIGIFLGEGII